MMNNATLRSGLTQLYTESFHKLHSEHIRDVSDLLVLHVHSDIHETFNRFDATILYIRNQDETCEIILRLMCKPRSKYVIAIRKDTVLLSEAIYTACFLSKMTSSAVSHPEMNGHSQ